MSLMEFLQRYNVQTIGGEKACNKRCAVLKQILAPFFAQCVVVTSIHWHIKGHYSQGSPIARVMRV